MKSKSIIAAFALLLACFVDISALESKDSLKVNTYPDAYLDTVTIIKKFEINNYSMLGFEAGYYYNNVAFNPSMRTGTFINYGHYALLFTHYQKMFGFMPYFGYRFGLIYGKQGFRFKEDKEKHSISYLYGDTVQETFDVVEIPFLMQGHMDYRFLKFFADVGIFGAYRLNIQRTGYNGKVPSDQYKFKDFENRFDYGLEGGFGVGFVLKPFELHISAKLRYSWGSLYKPNYSSEYYYRYANPWDGIISVGLHYHLSRRTGKTSAQIKKEAYDYVYHGSEK